MASPARRALLAAGAGALVAAQVVVPTRAYAIGENLKPDFCAVDAKALHALAAAPKRPSWVTERMQPERVWSQLDANKVNIRGAGVRIAVIDSGAQVGVSPVLTPPPLADQQTNAELPKFTVVNYVGDQADIEKRNEPTVDCGRGTAIAALINGQQVPGWNFTGMAPNAQVTVMRALGNGQPEELRARMVVAVQAAVAQRFDIINISQAVGDDPALKDAVAQAVTAGVIVVVAAGDGGKGAGPTYPAAYPGVIAVGASTRSDLAGQTSQSDPRLAVTVAAPGDDVPLLLPTVARPATMTAEQYLSWGVAAVPGQGTAYAAPVVTGVVALMVQHERAAGRTLTPAEAKRRLEMTADRPAGAVPDPQLGYGTVNPVNAVFGPFPVAGAPGTPEATPEPPPLQVPAPRDLGPLLIGLGVGAGAILLLVGGVVVSEALPAMRRRRYTPARPDE